jgi:hypothetical protein
MAWMGLPSFSSRPQPCSAIIRWPILASLGILAMQACKVSSTDPAAIPGSVVVPDPGATDAGSRSAACVDTSPSDAAKSTVSTEIVRFVSRVVIIACSSFDKARVLIQTAVFECL